MHATARVEVQPEWGVVGQRVARFHHKLGDRVLDVVGRGVRDFGRGEELVLPDRAAWITDGGDVTWAGGHSPSAGSYRGRVLEILLSGRFEPGASPLETQAPSLKAVFKSLFASGVLPEDAPGMIRRISGTTDVTVA